MHHGKVRWQSVPWFLTVTVVYLWFHGPSKSLFLTHRIFQCREIESSLSRHFAREKTEHTMPKHHIHKRRPKNVAFLSSSGPFLSWHFLLWEENCLRRPTVLFEVARDPISRQYSEVHSRTRWCVALAAVSAPWCLGQLPGAVSSANITVMQTNGSEHTANGPPEKKNPASLVEV